MVAWQRPQHSESQVGLSQCRWKPNYYLLSRVLVGFGSKVMQSDAATGSVVVAPMKKTGETGREIAVFVVVFHDYRFAFRRQQRIQLLRCACPVSLGREMIAKARSVRVDSIDVEDLKIPLKISV